MSFDEYVCSFPGCKHFIGTLERFLIHSRKHSNFDFVGDSNFESILTKYHGTYCCTLCNFGSDNFVFFGEHLRQHIFAESYKCGHCDVGVKTIHDLKLHFKNYHPNVQTTFQFHKNNKVLNLFLDVILQDSGNIYYLTRSSEHVVFMKSDTSFWFVILLASNTYEMNKIFLSKNMLEITDHKLLELFPGGHCVSDDDYDAVEHATSIENNASKFLDFLKTSSNKTMKKNVGRYKFDGHEFQCISCNFATQDSNIFRDHIWMEIHDRGECDHRQVNSCIFEGQQLCALVESTLYCLMFILNDAQPDEENLNSEELIRKSELPHESESKVNDAKRSYDIESEKLPEILHKKFRRGKHASRTSDDKNIRKDEDVPEINENTIVINSMLQYEKTSMPESNLTSVSRDEDNTIKRYESEQPPELDKFSMFPFGMYLRECASSEDFVELLHDVTPFGNVCENCSFSCSSQKLFKFHKIGCLRQRSTSDYSCPRCHQSYLSMISLYKHVSFHLGSTTLNLYSCCYCEKKSTKLASATGHLIEMHPCEHSLQPCDRLVVMNKNIQFLQRMYKCFVCGSGQSWPSGFIDHVTKIHGLSQLASYLSEKYVKWDSKVITFPKHFLFSEEDASFDKCLTDLSFEDIAIADLNNYDIEEAMLGRHEMCRRRRGTEKHLSPYVSERKSNENLISKVNVFNERMSNILKGGASQT